MGYFVKGKEWIKTLLGDKFKGSRLGFSLLAILITVSVLGWLVWRQRDIFKEVELQIKPAQLAISLAAYFLALLMVSIVWNGILKSLGSQVASWKNMLYFFIANLGKRLPGSVWYIVWRGQLYHQEDNSLVITSLASGIELSVLIVSGVLASLIFSTTILLKYPAGIWITLVLAVVFIIILQPRVLSWLLNKLSGKNIQMRYRSILTWIAAYVLVWIMGGVSLFFIGNAIIPISLSNLGYVIGVWSLVGVLSFVLFFLPTNLGFNEIGFSLLLAQIVPSPIAVLIAVASRICTTIFDLVITSIALGIDYLNRNKGNK